MSKRTDKSGDSTTAVSANERNVDDPFDVRVLEGRVLEGRALEGRAFEGSPAEEEEVEILLGAMFDGELSEADASRLPALRCEGLGGQGGPVLSAAVDEDTFREVRRALRTWHTDLMTDSATGQPHRCDVWSRIAPAVEVIAASNARRSVRERRFNAALRRMRAWVAGDSLDSREARGGMGWGLAIGSAAAAMFLFTQYTGLSSPHGESAATARRDLDADGPMTVASRLTEELTNPPAQPVMLAGLSSQQLIESGAAEGEHDIVSLAEQLARQTGRGGNPFAVIPRMEGIPGAEGVTILAARQDESSASSPDGVRARSLPMRLMAPQIDGFAASSRDFVMSVGTDGGLRAGNADIAWIRSANRFKLLSPRAEEGAPVIWVARRNAPAGSASAERAGDSASSR